MPGLAHKKTADMDDLRYSPDDSVYRFGPVPHYRYGLVRVSCSSMSTCGWDLFLGLLEWARAETRGLTEGGAREGARQVGLMPFHLLLSHNPCILGIPTISFQ